MEQEKSLIILDSNSVIHRAFHALPPLSNKKGVMLQAVYGFTTIFLKAIRDLNPGYIAACFDFPAKNFRHEQYDGYKAKRQKAPDELYSQFPLVKELLNGFGVKIFERQGFEADDLIATIAVAGAKASKIPIFIVSGDLDNTQLVSDQIKIYGWGKGVKDMVIYDEAKVKERFGVPPAQIIDYKALVGDTSDNIPGGKGIGPKLALQLLTEYRGVHDVFAKIESGEAWDMNQKTKDLVLKNKDLILMSYKLATARTDALSDFSLDLCQWQSYNKEAVIKIFNEFDFSSLINRLP